MNNTPASAGWGWVKQGFALFRKQPGGLSTLFLAYMIVTALLSLVPLLGQVVQGVLLPVFSIGFMRAAQHIQQDRPVVPALLATGFQKPLLGRLCVLGAVHVVAAVVAAGALLLIANGEVLTQIAMGKAQPDPELLRDSGLFPGMLMALLVYVPAVTVLSFAVPLVYWSAMGPGKALFYAFFAAKRAFLAFVVFAFSLFTIMMFGSQLVLLVLGFNTFAVALLRVLFVLLFGVAHCALYAAYCEMFGTPPLADAPPAKGPPGF